MSDASKDPAPFQEITELFRQGRHVELESAVRQWLESLPDNPFLWKALGVACGAQGKVEQAIEAKERAVELAPQDAEARSNLANALAEARRFAAAEGHFRAALRLDEGSVAAWQGLAGVLARTGRFEEAARCRGRACDLQPDSAAAFNLWGNSLREAGTMREARLAYERALAIDPANVEALSNLANTLADLGYPTEAEARYRAALELQPQRAEIHNNLGNLLKYLGRYAEALASFRSAMKLKPDFTAAHSNYLLALNHVPGTTPAKMKAAARVFGRYASRRAGGPLARLAGRDAARPLRVGFVSGDLRAHPVGYFLESTLEHWPSDKVELFAYPTFLAEDEMTRRMRPRFRGWTPIANLDDAQAAARIAAHGIDVLVDLAGYTAHGRLPLFAWRPAPVQVSWLGYFATTGIEQMDWLLADAGSVAPGEERWFTERIWRLPGTRMCFTPPRDAPAVAPLPAIEEHAVTFGSFQNLGKINDDVLALWARVLHAVPRSRLRVQNAQLGDGDSRAAFGRRLVSHGIHSARTLLNGRQPRADYLDAYANVDIALDTFPYPGGTTTCEALWMGVPTITLAGRTMLARQGESLLTAAGLQEWVARDEDDYVRIAVSLATDLDSLSRLRSGLRERAGASALFDAKRFAGELADAFVAMSASAVRTP